MSAPPPLPDAALANMHARDRACRARPGGYQILAELDRAALLREVGTLRALAAALVPRRSALEPILRLDPHTRDELLETLAAWAEVGNVSRAAGEIGRHHNTVRNRLRRVERLTGGSLTVPDDVTDLVLALRVHAAGIVVDPGGDDRPAEVAR